MALNATSSPSAQVVGHAFVEQYYHILHNSPEMVYRFYQDSSVLSRLDSNGVMTSVTTMKGINQKILSLDYKNYKAEIKTADAQHSYKEGVTVLVTGCLTGKDNLRRKFVQSFFLAPQDNGYFVLNDVFRYVEDGEVLEKYPNSSDDAPAAPSIPDPEPMLFPDPPAPDPENSCVEEDHNISESVLEPSDHERHSMNENEAVVESQSHAVENDTPTMLDSASSPAEEGAPKKSYASIVKVTNGGSGLTKVYVPTNAVKVAAKKTENQPIKSVKPASLGTSASVSTNAPQIKEAHEEVESHSIYIRNLPVNMTEDALEMEFKKFGAIKQGGIQVRHNKEQGYCFGFVEFHSLSSMDNAIQASPITIGGKEAVVEKKKNVLVGSGRGRFPSERERFRNDNFRGGGGYGGGRGFVRNDHRTRVEFQVRGRGSAGRGEGYPRGRGRGGRSGGLKQTAAVLALHSEQ